MNVPTLWSNEVRVINLKKSSDADFTDVTTPFTFIKASMTDFILASRPCRVSAEKKKKSKMLIWMMWSTYAH